MPAARLLAAAGLLDGLIMSAAGLLDLHPLGQLLGHREPFARLPGEHDPCVGTGLGILAIRKETDESGVDDIPSLRRDANHRSGG